MTAKERIYSYTQISQYLGCPRRYKHRYLDGWKEKDIRATMLFGRAFVANGRLFDRAALDQILMEVEAAAKRQK